MPVCDVCGKTKPTEDFKGDYHVIGICDDCIKEHKKMNKEEKPTSATEVKSGKADEKVEQKSHFDRNRKLKMNKAVKMTAQELLDEQKKTKPKKDEKQVTPKVKPVKKGFKSSKPKKVEKKIAPKPVKKAKDKKKGLKSPKPKPEKKKVIITKEPKSPLGDEFIDLLKPIGVTTRENKAKDIALRLDKAFGYISKKRYGFAYYIKKRVKGSWNWYPSGRVTTKDEMNKMAELIKEYVKSKKPVTLVKLGFLEK